MNKGRKDDQEKVQLGLIPLCALEAEAYALMHGAAKYGRNNFKLGMDYSRVYNAALRHLHAYIEGEDFDPETGIHHMGHVKACCSFILYYHTEGVGNDDRYKPAQVEVEEIV